MSSFAADVEAWCRATQARADEVLRAIALEVLSRVVTRSPVGNPELWAANQHAVEGRKALREAGASKARIKREFPLAAGKTYTGGRFRGNWQVSFDSPETGPIDNIDPNGSETIATGMAVLADAQIGVTIFVVNNLPYAERIEQGWSKQSPTGIVRITAVEFPGIVSDVASSTD